MHEVYGVEFDAWAKSTGFCNPEHLKTLQQAQILGGIVNINGDGHAFNTWVSKNLVIGKGDIVAIKIFPAADGRYRKPPEILRVAAKAKDATKANGCYWDASDFGPFRGQGGAVCGDWHWKNHPYTNPSLLKCVFHAMADTIPH